MSKLTILSLAVIPFSLLGCRESAPAAKAPTPAEWMLASEPAGALSVKDAKAQAKEGDAIVLRARIGGRAQPLTPGSPSFVVMDLSIPHCGQLPDDHCATPWDYCCEPVESIRAAAATVLIVGADARPAAPTPSEAGLRELDEIIIVGTVDARPTPDVLTIRATGVYRVPG